MVGTTVVVVTRYFCTFSQNACGENFSTITVSFPRLCATVANPDPDEWYSGHTTMWTSDVLYGIVFRNPISDAGDALDSSDRTAPFGRPVVPDVNTTTLLFALRSMFGS